MALATADGIELARRLSQEGKHEQAEVAYSRILDAAQQDTAAATEAVNFLALRSLERGNSARAVELLQKGLTHQPNDPLTLRNLGIVYEVIGQLEASAIAFSRAVHCAPAFFPARLGLGRVSEKLGRHYEALTAYFGAIVHAQLNGQWTNEATTPLPLRQDVSRAMAYVNQGRLALFSRVLEPLHQSYGREALRRVEMSLGMYLGELPRQYADPRQRPTFLYFPGLPARPFWNRESTAWVEELEARADAIGEEMREMMSAPEGVEPVHKTVPEAELGRFISSTRGPAAWDGYFFYRHGSAYRSNQDRCPRTTECLAKLPLIRVREHAPEVLFSVLKPGTRILPHRGVTNLRLVTHLPLLVPPVCGLKVADEIHTWEEGRCVVFDDTYEHEAWNESEQVRVVLILDVWNPYLTEVERVATADLIGAIGDFNRDCGIDV